MKELFVLLWRALPQCIDRASKASQRHALFSFALLVPFEDGERYSVLGDAQSWLRVVALVCSVYRGECLTT